MGDSTGWLAESVRELKHLSRGLGFGMTYEQRGEMSECYTDEQEQRGFRTVNQLVLIRFSILRGTGTLCFEVKKN